MLKIVVPCKDLDTARVLLDALEENGLVPEFAESTGPEMVPPIPTTPQHEPGSLPMLPATAAPPAESDPAAGVVLDSEGLPWDARIHTDKKTQTKAGAWKRRRGIDDGVFAQVIAELRAKSGGAAPVVPQTIAVPAAQIPVPQTTPATLPGWADVVGRLAGATAPAEEPEPVQPEFTNPTDGIKIFSDLVSDCLANGKVTHETVMGHYATAGVDLNQVADNMEMIQDGITYFRGL